MTEGRKISQKKWREKHKNEYNDYMREYQKSEKNREYRKKWYEKNKIKQLEYNKKYLKKDNSDT